MALETGLIGRALSMLSSLVGAILRRRQTQRWVGHWQAYNVEGRDLAENPMKGAGPTDVFLPHWWTVSTKLKFQCYDCDSQGQPTRHQTGHISLDSTDPDSATRVGCYLDSDEFYEQRLRMITNDKVLIIPVPERSTLGNVYGKHGWRRIQ